jgi:predicted AAA+ superfamily ATPase
LKADVFASYATRPSFLRERYRDHHGLVIEDVFISGLLPPHYVSVDPIQDLRSYVADYLKEEIAVEAVVQNIPAFAEFLRVAALTSGELLNYTNIGRESGVSAKVVRNYFQILEDTLLGFRVQPWRKVRKRRLIETEKFYLFDVGVTNYLSRRTPKMGTPEFGHSFENFMLMELKAYQAYRNPELDIRYWRTSTGFEVTSSWEICKSPLKSKDPSMFMTLTRGQ